MEPLTDSRLLEMIDDFLKREGMVPSRFGREAMNDGDLIPQLRRGRSLTLKNAEKVMKYMASYAPEVRAA